MPWPCLSHLNVHMLCTWQIAYFKCQKTCAGKDLARQRCPFRIVCTPSFLELAAHLRGPFGSSNAAAAAA